MAEDDVAQSVVWEIIQSLLLDRGQSTAHHGCPAVLVETRKFKLVLEPVACADEADDILAVSKPQFAWPEVQGVGYEQEHVFIVIVVVDIEKSQMEDAWTAMGADSRGLPGLVLDFHWEITEEGERSHGRDDEFDQRFEIEILSSSSSSPNTNHNHNHSNSSNNNNHNNYTTTSTTSTTIIMAQTRHTLRAAVPAAGFLWEPRSTILRKVRQDRAVIAALRDHGGLANLQRGSAGHARADIEQALAGMFDAARRAVDADTDLLRGRDAFEFVSDHLWHSGVVAWARPGALGEERFIDLFFEVYRRRLDWHANPREPFDTSEHGPLAHSVDAFHHVASDYWGEADFDMWAMAQAPAEEGSGADGHGDDPAAAAPHTLETGASHAPGEPHPQATISGGQDQDRDVNMGEAVDAGAVEEARSEFSRLNLYEDVEMEW
ncbi:hypothetical protein INS49_007545 [Diaporthe citri]|uniref:uncharacterized protein n=1 Tax=Diaporthe citri TaxID=83186 RepID=UPI001C821B15|nr:uncharacterized protein INS49_007545 [Diaporthe citri]KAG6353304.1 hypothetical protein INS49_007545 [Diaporthe citri]